LRQSPTIGFAGDVRERVLGCVTRTVWKELGSHGAVVELSDWIRFGS